jgi:hypothetical protein
LNGDIGFYGDDKECIPFLNYLVTQYMRTSIANVSDAPLKSYSSRSLDQRRTRLDDRSLYWDFW